MSVVSKYNKKPMFNYDNEKERSFAKLKDLVQNNGIDKKYEVHALFINTKSKFGDEPVIVTNLYMVNAPQHLLETVKEMRDDEELINLINEGKVLFSIYEYNGKNGKGYSVEWEEK